MSEAEFDKDYSDVKDFKGLYNTVRVLAMDMKSWNLSSNSEASFSTYVRLAWRVDQDRSSSVALWANRGNNHCTDIVALGLSLY
jgi:hypothetical protein